MTKSPDPGRSRADDNPPLIHCGYYKPGHDPHFIQVIRVAEPICDVRAVIGDAHAEGGVWITLTFPDGHVESWWDHDRRRVESLLSTEQPCEWKTTDLLLVGPGGVGVGQPAFYLSKTANLIAGCPSSNDPKAPESARGGFLIGPPSGKNWADLTPEDVDAIAKQAYEAIAVPPSRGGDGAESDAGTS